MKVDKESSNVIKDIDDLISKHQKKIEELQNKKKTLNKKVIESRIEMPESIEAIVGHICLRYNISYLVGYHYGLSRFCVIGFDTHENCFWFDDSGKLSTTLDYDFNFPFIEEKDDCEFNYMNYFCAKFTPNEYKEYTVTPVMIDVYSGEIQEEE